MNNTMTESAMRSLVGHRFPGGRYRIQHWENWLLTDCTGADPLPDGLVHPIALFHVPILGSGTSITELFALFGAEGAGSVGLEGYDWEYLGLLREDVEYRIEGGIAEVERRTSDAGQPYDAVAFVIELIDDSDDDPDHDDVVVARVTNRWRIRREAP